MDTALPSDQRYLLVFAAVFLLLFGGIWLYTVTARMAFMDMDYGQWAAKDRMLDRCDVGTTAIVGDSRAAAAYVPSLLGGGVRNLALTGATAAETYYEVSRILACPDVPRNLVISFSPKQYEEIVWLWLHAVSYDSLTFADLQEIAAHERRFGLTDLYHGAFGSEPPPAMKNWMYVHHFPSYDFASLIAARGIGRLAANRRIVAETLAARGQHIIGIPETCATGPARETLERRFRPHPVITAYFRRMLALLDRRGIGVVIAPTPISEFSARRLDPRYVAGFEDYIRRETAPFRNVAVADDLLPVMPDCAFGDAHHLHQQGAEAFSRRIAPLFAPS